MDQVSSGTQLSISTSRLESATVRLGIVGEIDIASAPQVQAAVLGLMDGSGEIREIQIDLAGVSFLDAVGVGVLVDGWRAAARAGIRLEVHNPRGMVSRVLAIPGIADGLPLAPAPAQARTARRTRSRGGDGITRPWSHRAALF